MKTRLPLACLVVFLLISLPAASGLGDTIKIGGIFALTGVGADQGQQELKAIQLAIEETNNTGGIAAKTIELIAEDVSIDKMNQAATAAQKLINIDRVVAVIGPTWDEPAQAILPIFEAAKVPIIGPNQTEAVDPDNRFKFFFCTWPSSAVGVHSLLQYAARHGIKRVAIIRPIAAGFYEYVSTQAQQSAKDFGLEIIATEDLNDPVATNFRSVLLKIKTKSPDAILIVLNETSLCPMMRQLRELKLSIPVLATDAAGNETSLRQCPKEMEQLVFSYPRGSHRYPEFVKRFQLTYNTPPLSASAGPAYDALNVLVVALKKTNGQGGEVLQQELSRTKDFTAVSFEAIDFSKTSYATTADDGYVIRTVKAGEFVDIK